VHGPLAGMSKKVFSAFYVSPATTAGELVILSQEALLCSANSMWVYQLC
jgi:hypothetical protein